MEFRFREDHQNPSTFQYRLPEFFVSSEFEDLNDVEVGIPTTRNKPDCCEYEPHEVKGLSSACDEEGIKGPDVYGDGKNLPKTEIAASKTNTTFLMPGAKPDDKPIIEPERPSLKQPQDHSTPQMTNFTDFFNNFQTLLKNFAETATIFQQQQQPPLPPQPNEPKPPQPPQQSQRELRKRKSDKDDTELPQSRRRLSKYPKIKTVKK